MCGIAGGVDASAQIDLTALVSAIVSAQHRRGPDASHVQSFGSPSHQAVFGHNRLSIIALGKDADQPMADCSGRYVITYNGEIYNYLELRAELVALGHSFRTSSDTEVILEAFSEWGVNAFERFIGMFALAIYDLTSGALVLARDRFGKKPLFYHATPQSIVFASSTQVIARHAQLQPNLEYVARGIALKYYEDDGETSPFEGLCALPAGCYLTVKTRGGVVELSHGRYYDAAAAVACESDRLAGLSENQLLEELATLLKSAVGLRLGSDVPVGISLSGGVDSSILAAICAQSGAALTAYSFSNPSDATSEGPLVQQVAAMTGTPVRYVWPQSADAIQELFWKTLAAQGAPIPHVSMLAQFAVFEAARIDGIKVLLGGQGGDESFMGYRKFYLFRLQDIVRRRAFAELPAFAAACAWLAPSIAKRAALFWAERKRYAGGDAVMETSLTLPSLKNSSSPAMAADESVRSRQILDITRYSLPTLLRYEDRNSMANSVESRLPLCDHRLVAFGVALPETMKLRKGYGKYLLREAAKGLIPESVRTLRDKRGFDVRQESWVATGLGQGLRQALRDRRSGLQPYLQKGTDLDEAFSDARLTSGPQPFKEAVSLLWLADPYAGADSTVAPSVAQKVEAAA